MESKKVYSANRYDCVGFVLERLGLKIKRSAMPLGWWHSENKLLDNLVELIKSGQLTVNIKKIILKQECLLPGDIIFLRIRGKYTHHLGIAKENNHIEHNLPTRGITLDYLRPNSGLFRFGVRLWD